MSWDVISDYIAWGFFIIGALFVIVGALGILRFPDFYTRIHASGLTDTLGAEFILIGMAIQAPSWLIAAKILMMMIFLLLTSPVATHAVAHAAWVGGLNPLTGKDLTYDEVTPTEEEPEGRV